MRLKILTDDIDGVVKVADGSSSAPRSSKMDNYLVNNNPITATSRDYVLEVEGLPCSFEGHKDHKMWKEFLKMNPHLISNFDTRDPVKLQFLFDRWKERPYC